jgi:hypothetical protein
MPRRRGTPRRQVTARRSTHIETRLTLLTYALYVLAGPYKVLDTASRLMRQISPAPSPAALSGMLRLSYRLRLR